jgi:hypothetical protein
VHERRALALRPGSPYAWSSLALIKLKLGERDAELHSAIVAAARLGPWEPEVQLALAEIAFRAFEELPAAAQGAVRGAIERGLKRQDAKIFEMARRSGRLALLCAVPGIAVSRLAILCI